MDSKKALNGSMTIEMSFLMPVLLLMIMSSIFAVFYFHDKNVLSAAAYETAVVGSVKMREKKKVAPGELEALFRERTARKCILFSGSSVRADAGEREVRIEASANKGRLGLSVVKSAAVTEPENHIRDIRRLKKTTGLEKRGD